MLQIQTVIRGPLRQRNMGLALIVPYAGKEKSITFSSLFHTIKARKSWAKETDFWMLLSCKKKSPFNSASMTKPHAATVSNKFVVLWTAGVPWYLLCLFTTRSAFLRYYALNVRSRGKQLVLFSRESWCFQRLVCRLTWH